MVRYKVHFGIVYCVKIVLVLFEESFCVNYNVTWITLQKMKYSYKIVFFNLFFLTYCSFY